MTIQEMIARQQAIVSGARAAGRDLTAEERAEFDGLQRQIDAAGNNPPAQGNEGQGGEDPTGGARGMGNDNGQQGTDPTEAARQAVATERQRVSDITALCRQAGMDPAEYISNGATMDTVRQAAVDYLLKHGAPVSSRMNGDEGDNFRQAAVDAMLLRAGANVQNPAKGAEEMRGYESPSNKDLRITATVLKDGTTVALDQQQANDVLNANGVITAINANGFKSWGNNTAAYPSTTDPKDRWWAVRRFFDWDGNNFIQTYFQKVDKPGNKRLIQSIVDSQNIIGNGYVARDYCAGYRVEFRSDENPVTNLLAGHLTVHTYLAPYIPAEYIENIREYDVDALESAIGGE